MQAVACGIYPATCRRAGVDVLHRHWLQLLLGLAQLTHARSHSVSSSFLTYDHGCWPVSASGYCHCCGHIALNCTSMLATGQDLAARQAEEC